MALILGGALTAGLARASGLDDLLGRSAPTLLPVELAFAVRLARQDAARVLEWDIAPGYYLYRDRLRVEAISPPAHGAKPGSVSVVMQLPKGEVMDDETFGQVEVYRGQERVPLVVNPPDAALAGLRVHYQGCAEGRACYSPAVRVLTVETP